MADRIIPLNCPACGSAGHEGLRERSFGGEMKCGHCGVTSVLVIDNQWHQKRSGEYVCRGCGNIAREGHRFCECRLPLIRKCVMCSGEFFVGKNVCPNCGWDHSIDLSDESRQRSIATNLMMLVRSGQFEEARGELHNLTTCVTAARSLTPEAEAVFREILLMQWEDRIPIGNYYFKEQAKRILEELSGIKSICDWAAERSQEKKDKERQQEEKEKRLRTLGTEIRSIEDDIKWASKESCGAPAIVYPFFPAVAAAVIAGIFGLGGLGDGIQRSYEESGWRGHIFRLSIAGFGGALWDTIKGAFMVLVVAYGSGVLLVFCCCHVIKMSKLSALRAKKNDLEEKRQALAGS